MAFVLVNTDVPSDHTTGPAPSLAQYANTGMANAVAYYTIIDDSGKMKLDTLTLTGNSSALTRKISSVDIPMTGIYNGEIAGYSFGGDNAIAPGGGTGIAKLPFASGTDVAQSSGIVPLSPTAVLDTAKSKHARGTAKSGIKAYLIGGAASVPAAFANTMSAFPFAVGDTHGSYAIPATLPIARGETQLLSDMGGGNIYAAGGGTGPALTVVTAPLPAPAAVFKMPSSSDTGPVTSTGSLVTGRALGGAWSTPTTGIVAGGQNVLAMLDSIESFPWSSETWSAATPSTLVAYKYAAIYQSLTTGYQALGANNAPTQTQPNSDTTRQLAVASFPFSSLTTITSTPIPGVPRVTNRNGFSGLYEAIIAHGWPGLATPEPADGDIGFRVPYSSGIYQSFTFGTGVDRVHATASQV